MKTSIATSIKYGNYNHLMRKAVRYTQSFERNWALVCETLDIDVDTDVEIHIKPIKGPARGNYDSTKRRINIDPRKFSFTFDAYETLAHEAQHMKQMDTGVMSYVLNETKRAWLTVWKGKTYVQPTTHNAYLNRPWEVEARAAGKLGRTAYINKVKTREAKETEKFLKSFAK